MKILKRLVSKRRPGGDVKVATTVKFTFGQEGKSQERFTLEYELYDSDFCRRWAASVQLALNAKREISNGGNFFGSCFVDEVDLRQKMVQSINMVNSHKKDSITRVPYPNMSREFILKLHEDFERLEPQPDFREKCASMEVKKALQDLNIHIHKYEGLHGPKLTHVDVLLHPVDRYCFEPEDYKLFTTVRKFGELHLAYGVTGVPVLHAFFNNHEACPVPQYNYTAGATLCFRDEKEFTGHEKLDEWLRTRWGWSLDDDNLALGYISLGQMITKISTRALIKKMKECPKILSVEVTPVPSEEVIKSLKVFDEKTWVPAGPKPFKEKAPPKGPEKFEGPLPKFLVRLQSEDGKSNCELEYELTDHEVTRKWLPLVCKAAKNRYPIIEGGRFYGFSVKSRETLISELQTTLESLRKKSGEALSGLGLDFSPDGLKKEVKIFSGFMQSLDATPGVTQAVRKLATETLHLYHQLQECGRQKDQGHFNLDFNPVESIPLEGDDYKLFSTDEEWGALYLTYGQLGCPTLNAFHEKRKDSFDPQRSICSGVTAKFYGDFKFWQHRELKHWLSQVAPGRETDPTLAIGAIKLGQLRTSLPREQVAEMVSKCRKAKEIALISNTPDQETQISPAVLTPDPSLTPAAWPRLGEIFRHLEHTPWLFLPLEFDAKACYKEAETLLNKFVVHRGYDQSSMAETGGKWKSLGINALNGDSSKTQNHVDYGITDPHYKLSEVAARCPKTLEFLTRLTDLSQCQRVRFMLLEPGARIAVHSDAPGKEVAYAVNIALNMPEGCEFWTGLNPDGTHNMFTRQIPIEDGSVFIFNNATYHMVENRSNTPRIHIIIHGPIRFTDSELLDLARKQNGLPTHKSLINTLVSKYALLGQDIKQDLHAEWMTAGTDSQVFPKTIRLAVVKEKEVDPELGDEVLNQVTMASFFPAMPPVVSMDEVDGWLRTIRKEGATHAVLVTAGTYITNTARFFVETLKAIHFLSQQDAALMGHIMNRPQKDPNDPKILPFLHEQFVILDLKRWNEVGAVPLDTPYCAGQMKFPGYQASDENIHDDYTPVWLKPNTEAAPREGTVGWGTRLMAASLEKGRSVVNVPLSLRMTKKFAYPRSGRCPQYEDIKNDVGRYLRQEESRVFVFNNETLRIMNFPDFKPDALISVAAGFKPFSLLRQFWKEPGRRAQITFIDFSAAALTHIQKLIKLETSGEILDLLQTELTRQNMQGDNPKKLVEDSFIEVLRDGFNHNLDELVDYLKAAGKGEFVFGDFISDPDQIISRVKPGEQLLFWHSNAWSSNVAYYLRSRDDLEKNYLSLGRAIQKKSGLKGWKRVGYHEMVFGKTLEAPQIVVTAGGDTSDYNPERYRPLDSSSPLSILTGRTTP